MMILLYDVDALQMELPPLKDFHLAALAVRAGL
jgi:hypothetical protein